MDRRLFLTRVGHAGLGLGVAGLAEAVPPQRVSPPTPAGAGVLSANRFDYLPINDRPVIRWPNNARVAVWVAPNIEWYEYTPQSRPTRPDVMSYSYRDYGTRVGFWRMLEVLDKHSIRCCVCLNAGVLDHCPDMREAMVARNWDYMAHGFYNTRPITSYTIEQEREYWRDIIATVKKHTGKQLKGRLGAGGGNTVNTPDLMVEAGLVYHTDWMCDDQPIPMKVKDGRRFIHVPYSYQLNDASMQQQGREAEYFSRIIKDQFDVLYEEGAENGKVMCIALHPFWIGKAARVPYLDDVLAYIRSHDAVWHTTADDIADYYIEHYYDAVAAHIEQRRKLWG